MNIKLSIYLSGSIKKSHEKANESFWTDEEILLLKTSLPEYDISFLNPAFRTDNLSDPRSVFGRDMVQVCCCDVVFVDARDRRGLGVGAEMMWAKFRKIPVVTLAPKDSCYSKSKTTLLDTEVENWIHPFVASLSDAVVENLVEGAAWVRKLANSSVPQPKDVEHIQSAMQHYLETQLPHDEPMKELLLGNQKLYERVWEVKNEQKEMASPY
jgi:hypothetical protein